MLGGRCGWLVPQATSRSYGGFHAGKGGNQARPRKTSVRDFGLVVSTALRSRQFRLRNTAHVHRLRDSEKRRTSLVLSLALAAPPLSPLRPLSDSPSTDTMAPVSIAARAAMRAAAPARAVRALSTSTALQGSSSSTFESPFKGESKASKIPDFGKYMSKGSGSTNMLFSYFMVGTMGAITAAGAKSTIQGES